MKKKCSICGRETNRTYNRNGYHCVCAKHSHQIEKYGHPLDNNPRAVNDLNDYKTNGIIATFNLYDQNVNKVGEFVIDFEDLPKVKYHKWRLSKGKVMTGFEQKHSLRDVAAVILGYTYEDLQHIRIDHIDGNEFNNRKYNLCIVHLLGNQLCGGPQHGKECGRSS